MDRVPGQAPPAVAAPGRVAGGVHRRGVGLVRRRGRACRQRLAAEGVPQVVQPVRRGPGGDHLIVQGVVDPDRSLDQGSIRPCQGLGAAPEVVQPRRGGLCGRPHAAGCVADVVHPPGEGVDQGRGVISGDADSGEPVLHLLRDGGEFLSFGNHPVQSGQIGFCVGRDLLGHCV